MEPKPAYITDTTDTTESDDEMAVRALDLLLAVMSARQLLALANRCNRRGRAGFGYVKAVWKDGRPALLCEEASDNWR